MKNLFTLIVFVLLAGSLLSSRLAVAQAPDKMSYQAVIRDASGGLVTEQEIGMKISILQGSVFGASVYIETQSPVTNENGLVTIVIGNGEVVHGTFSGIDWSAGPWFIKTETDPSGGTTYTISGTSQLLSVPYAFHAKTAETISEPIVESDPLFDASPAAGIEAADIGNWDEAYSWGNHADGGYITTETDPTFTTTFSITDPADGDLLRYNDATDKWEKYTPDYAAGTHVHTIATDEADGFMSAADKEKLDGLGGSLSIGDSHQGGIIFWLDASGEHGLIAATTDQSTNIQWFNGTYTWTTAFASAVGAGYGNTRMIVHNQGAGDYAAQLCRDLSLGGYNDWYLPSKYELNLMYQNIGQGNLLGLGNVGAFANANYWSSSESAAYYAWYQFFYDGTQNYYSKYDYYRVRAVRAF